jgi:hypothetical protein
MAGMEHRLGMERVCDLSDAELREIVARASDKINVLYWTPREKDAKRELQRRESV